MANIKKLEGKVAIVTGGASGIGEVTARRFAEHGALVVIADIQPEKGRSVVESIGSQRCSYVQCDVTDEEQVKSMIDWTATTYGGLDIMFSNAGIMSKSTQTVMEFDMSQLDVMLRVNVRGMAICVKQAAHKMVELGTRGAIICTASVAATQGGIAHTDYTVSKHAVLGLVRSACMQLGVYGIRVNCVSPAAVPTPMIAQMGFPTPEEVDAAIGPFTSLKGVSLTAEHVADAVVFLASGEAAFVSGHDLLVDGGLIVFPFVEPQA